MARLSFAGLAALATLSGCLGTGSQFTPARVVAGPLARYELLPAAVGGPIQERLDQYTSVRLTADLAPLSRSERAMIPLLIDAARAMDEIYWVQAYGSRDSLLAAIPDARVRRFAEVN